MPENTLNRREPPRIVVLDEDFEVALSDGRCGEDLAVFRSAARRIVAGGAGFEAIALGDQHYVVRVTRLAGADGQRYALLIEPRGTRRPLMNAYERFGLSPREVDVLALIIDGASNRQIAEVLCITEATVQDHVHSLSQKVGARGRGALLARVFDVGASIGQAPPE